MIIKVRLFGYLAKYCKKGPFEEFEFAVPEGSTPGDLLKLLGIPGAEIMFVINPGEKERVLIINAACDTEKKIGIKANDRIWVYPFLDGG